jgi:hypothetical protein
MNIMTSIYSNMDNSNIDNDQDVIEYNEDYFKDNGYKYPLEFILTVKDQYRGVHNDLSKVHKVAKVYCPPLTKGKGSIHSDEIINEDDIKILDENIKKLLNQISNNNINVVVSNIKKLKFNTIEKLQLLAQITIKKATYEMTYVDTYAKLCKMLLDISCRETTDKTFLHVLLEETKKEFEMLVIISPSEAKKLEGDDNDESDLTEKKRKKIGIVKFVAELYNSDVLTIKIINICFGQMLTIIRTCDKKSVRNARDFIMECLIEYIKVLSKSKINDPGYITNINSAKTLGDEYPVKRLQILMKNAIK